MPTIFEFKGYRFFFFSSDRNEPIHIHVEKDDSYCKFWLESMRLSYTTGFKPVELTEIRKIIENRKDIIKERWDEFFTR